MISLLVRYLLKLNLNILVRCILKCVKWSKWRSNELLQYSQSTQNAMEKVEVPAEKSPKKDKPSKPSQRIKPSHQIYVPPHQRLKLEKNPFSVAQRSNHYLCGIPAKCGTSSPTKIENQQFTNLTANDISHIEMKTPIMLKGIQNQVEQSIAIDNDNAKQANAPHCNEVYCSSNHEPTTKCARTKNPVPKYKIRESASSRFGKSKTAPSVKNIITSDTPQTSQLLNISTAGVASEVVLRTSKKHNPCFNKEDGAYVAPVHFDEDESDAQIKNNTNMYISFCNDKTDKKASDKDDPENEKRIQRTIENINRRSKPLIKHIRSNDTLCIEPSERLRQSYNSNYVNDTLAEFDDLTIHDSNLSDWEDMLNEDYDLQNHYIEQIQCPTGCDSGIVEATNNCSSYQNLVLQDLEHVIELYDFPSSFKTHDIIQLYSDAYQDTMYVKWCDETHALLVLSAPAQAQRALQIEHHIIKSRPLTEASRIATYVAGCTDLKPSMKRPATNMLTAKRLINTHLGTKNKLNRDALEQERKLLNNARDQKRLARQNERDSWEGNPRNTN